MPLASETLRINTPAVERRAARLATGRSLKGEWQAAWLCNAIRCIDLTTLAGDDTPARVARLCAKARQPIAGFSSPSPSSWRKYGSVLSPPMSTVRNSTGLCPAASITSR